MRSVRTALLAGAGTGMPADERRVPPGSGAHAAFRVVRTGGHAGPAGGYGSLTFR